MKFSLVFVILLVLLFGGGLYYFFYQSEKSSTDSPRPAMQSASGEQVGEGLMTKENSRYVVYTKDVFDNTAEKKRVLFFYANWCPTCRLADASFSENTGTIPDDVVVIRVNYNDPDTDAEEKALAQKYGVTYQHTFVQIDEQGTVETKWNGGEIDELLENML